MGSTESTGRSNGTEEERQGEDDNSRGGSGGAGAAIAVAAAGAAVAAWGISRMLSDNKDTENQGKDDVMKIKAPGTETYLLNSGTTSHAEDKSEYRSYPTRITWSPPLAGRFKMNTDGATRVNPGLRVDGAIATGPSGYGGILRDHCGECILAFHGFIGASDCLTAEFTGVLKGLELLDKRGYRDSILESDSTAAIDWINRKDSPYLRHREIIKKCRLLVRENGITLSLIYREANKCADKLANMAIEKKEGYKEITNLPDEIQRIVNQEKSSVF